MPLNPLVESFYPQSVNDDAMAQPPCESVLLNPLADTFSPRHSLGEEPTIRYDADYEIWHYEVNECRQTSTYLFRELI